MTIHYLTRAEKPEPLSIETALERDLKRSIAAVEAKKAAEAARAEDNKRWAEDAVGDAVAHVMMAAGHVDMKKYALDRAQKALGPFPDVNALYRLIGAQSAVIEAQDVLAKAHEDHFTLTQGRK